MNNFLKPGKRMTYTAPAGGVVSGGVYLIAGMFVVAATTQATAGQQFEGDTVGVFKLTKLAGEGALVEGQSLYWDIANARCTIDPTAGFPIGTVDTGGAQTGDVTVGVRLHGVSLVGRSFNIRKRFPIAGINAGDVTLIPDTPGVAIRMIDAAAIAIGGAVTSVTTVDVKSTQATASVKLVANAQASLTQSTLLRAGAAGAAILADGASFAPNDRGKGVKVGITGAAITVATNVDIEFTYAVE